MAFAGNLLPLSTTLTLEAAGAFEMSVHYYKAARRHNQATAVSDLVSPEDEGTILLRSTAKLLLRKGGSHLRSTNSAY